MTAVNSAQRKLLETTIVDAREAAEAAARAALTRLAVDQETAFLAMSPDDRSLRKLLRAEARRLGSDGTVEKGFAPLVTEVAYQQWHQMLFARFLAENDLLLFEGTPVTLSDCEELAPEFNEPDAWAFAARCASAMLPGVFRLHDPALRVRFAVNERQELKKLLGILPPAIFHADDSLGWAYQFWQGKAKTEVNASGRKVGGADISPVTQLFTEHYMVQFLLHNSLGAWWAGKHPGEELPTDVSYLRQDENGLPASGTFSGWPRTAKGLKILDPSCGSGHFLVAAFALMVRFRMAEENLSERDAGDAVLRDNLFGLELDPRCTQIAALALAAWKHGDYRELPPLNIACAGLPVGARENDWIALSDGADVPTERDRIDLEHTLKQLYVAFKNAPDLGSLLDPQALVFSEALFAFRWEQIGPILDRALLREKGEDPVANVFGRAAKGVAHAAKLLTGKYDLVVTNVPYLARGKQDDVLRVFCGTNYQNEKADLATVFLRRCLKFCNSGGSVAVVMPQNWLFLGSYAKLRSYLLNIRTLNVVARLGTGAFDTISGEVVNVGLFVLTNAGKPHAQHAFAGLDVSVPRTAREKAELLQTAPVQMVGQAAQLNNPDARISLDEAAPGKLLEIYSRSFKGVTTGDDPHYRRNFWELPRLEEGWVFMQSTVDATAHYDGLEHIAWFQAMGAALEEAEGEAMENNEYLRDREIGKISGVYIRARATWGKRGVAVSQMGQLPVALSRGEPFDTNTGVVLPDNPAHLAAIWCFCSSPDFNKAVRRIDQALKVTNASLVKVPFDLAHWQKVAEEKYPDGLPEPHSDDPTQWLFTGHPARATTQPGDVLQVAVARLLGYRWPRQTGAEIPGCGLLPDDGLTEWADADGIVCLPSVAGEQTADVRLRGLLAAALGTGDAFAAIERLLSDAGYSGKTLDEYLRDGFFSTHLKRFHNRPFVWHIWDGRKDGFSALVNYHGLTHDKLKKLAFTYLNDWIHRQRDDEKNEVPGAGARLVEALKLQKQLEAILLGEPPFDIFVRWKDEAHQPMGWEPDLNDGVRLNIRPFVEAGVLRVKKPSINWNKDRGTNPDGSPNGAERLNDRHLTLAEKRTARVEAEE